MWILLPFTLGESPNPRCVAPTELAPEPEGLELIHVQIITRHGQRTPLSTFLPYEHRGYWRCDGPDAISPREEANPGIFYRYYRAVYDDDAADFPGNCMSGDLLIEGMQQHQELGKSYRKRFVDETKFLPSHFNPPEFYFQSSYIERTFRSQEAFLTGLYPVLSENELIGIETASNGKSPLFPSSAVCPELSDISKKYQKSEIYKNYTSKWEILKDIGEQVGLTNTSKNIAKLCEWVVTVSCKPVNAPPTLTEEAINACHEVFAAEQWALYSSGRGVGASYTLREMLSLADKTITGKSNVKFVHLSAHDTSIAAIVTTLEDDPKYDTIPPFASHVTFEVYHSKESKIMVRFLYNGHVIPIGTLGTVIEYDQLRTFLAPYLEHCPEVPMPDQ